MSRYTYLNDEKFLKVFDCENRKEQYIKIIVLDFTTERPIANIEGKSTSGSCNLSGTSNMRRTASCSLVVDPDGITSVDGKDFVGYGNITEVQNLISMNKKVRIETGFKNTLKNITEWETYKNYNIIWFPLGTFVIKAANVSKNNSEINISLTLNDKCALLNGDMGGVIPAATVFSEMEDYNETGTERIVKKLLIKDIIKNLVVEFGGENPNNVFITDIQDYVVKVMKWNGSTNVILRNATNNDEKYLELASSENPATNADVEFTQGQDIGYTVAPFVYPGTLECNAGETVAAMLDKIKNVLGNFEWFYDIDGRFHFQEIRNYLNTSQAKTLLDLKESDYLSSNVLQKSVYTFDEDNKILLTSISNSPQFQNIKNDFTVWGIRKIMSGASKPIRYHLAFAKKPDISTEERRAIIYTDYRGLQALIPIIDGNLETERPSTESDKKKYYYDGTDIWSWSKERNAFVTRPGYSIITLDPPKDWRTELYYQGLWNGQKTFNENPYLSELLAEWPKIFDFKNNKFKEDIDPTEYEYWLDFLEGSEGGSSSISQFSINNIGRRAKVVTDNNSNCLFAAKPPEYIYVEADGDTKEEIENAGFREVIQVSPDMYRYITLGGSQNPAFDKIKELITQFTSYNESVSISVIPIYHLEPNTRISVVDTDIGVQGDYLIKTISLPLAIGGTSSISAVRCLEKTI